MFSSGDNGFNDFQITVANLRAKSKKTQTMYDLALQALLSSLEKGDVKVIVSKAQNEYKLHQLLTFQKNSCELAHRIHKRFKELWAENPSKEVQEMYIELCSYRDVVGVPELGNFWMKHKIIGDCTPKALEEMDESGVALYLRDFLKTHKVKKKQLEVIEQCFPVYTEDSVYSGLGEAFSQIPVNEVRYSPDE